MKAKWSPQQLKQFIWFILLFIMLGISQPTNKVKAASFAFPPHSPSEIISSINAYRAANGLNSLQSNGILMALAQGHSEYQASISTITHTGPGGSSPKERAIAAGYNGGVVSYYSEIIYGGTNTTVSMAINWWKGSAIHNEMMLAPAFNEVGAGIASAGGWNFYTAEFGYSSGVSGGGPNAYSNNYSSEEGNASYPVVQYAMPVMTVTPNEDGSIVHVLQTGQVLWTLSVVYGVELDQLLKQNDLNLYDFVYEGDEILIRAAYTPTATQASPTPSLTPQPTVTPRPSHTATSTTVALATKQIAFTPTPVPAPENQQNLPVRWIIIGTFLVLFTVVLVSLSLPRAEINQQ